MQEPHYHIGSFVVPCYPVQTIKPIQPPRVNPGKLLLPFSHAFNGAWLSSFPVSPAPQSFPSDPKPVEPGFIKTNGCASLAAGLAPFAVLCAALWCLAMASAIPTWADAQQAYGFCRALIERLESYRLKDFANVLKIRPLRGGGGELVLQGSVTYAKEELELIRKEFDRLNVSGKYKWDDRRY